MDLYFNNPHSGTRFSIKNVPVNTGGTETTLTHVQNYLVNRVGGGWPPATPKNLYPFYLAGVHVSTDSGIQSLHPQAQDEFFFTILEDTVGDDMEDPPQGGGSLKKKKQIKKVRTKRSSKKRTKRSSKKRTKRSSKKRTKRSYKKRTKRSSKKRRMIGGVDSGDVLRRSRVPPLLVRQGSSGEYDGPDLGGGGAGAGGARDDIWVESEDEVQARDDLLTLVSGGWAPPDYGDALMNLAVDMGIDNEMVVAADNAEDRIHALITLIRAYQVAEPPISLLPGIGAQLAGANSPQEQLTILNEARTTVINQERIDHQLVHMIDTMIETISERETTRQDYSRSQLPPGTPPILPWRPPPTPQAPQRSRRRTTDREMPPPMIAPPLVASPSLGGNGAA
jgi:hypothetical protein